MSARKVGKALEEALAVGPEEPEPPELKARTMGGLRMTIFEHLCRFPCSTLSYLSREVGHSLHTIEWHMRKLLAARYVSEAREIHSTVYFPAGLVEQDDIPLFSALNKPGLKRTFLHILEKPGSVQREISAGLGASHQSIGRATERLEALGLVSRIEDGRFARYYPSELLAVKREAGAGRVKRFRDSVLQRLASEGLRPKVLRSSTTELMVELSRGQEGAVLRLSLDPFVTVLG